jgi:hypothetical protein
MTKQDELELFDYLSRQHKLRDWLNRNLAADMKVLVQSNDIDQLRKAQGRAGLLEKMLALMDAAPAALKKQ